MNNHLDHKKSAHRAYEALQEAIRCIHLLAYIVSKDQIRTDYNYLPDLQKWVYVLSFMARRICSHFLGATDFDPKIQDLNFQFINKEEF